MAIAHCKPTGPKFVDITGNRYSKLTVVSYAGMRGRQLLWNCVCDCGGECIKYGTQLKYRANQDCGCEYNLAGEYKAKYAKEYSHWRSMRNRCLNINSDGYEYYGGAGVKICERWKSFPAFMEDMGPQPTPSHTLDRYPNQTGDYEPNNCRWATPKEQCNNRRNNTLVTIDETTRTMQEWCDIYGVSKNIVCKRLKRGWDAKDAVFTKSLRPDKV